VTPLRVLLFGATGQVASEVIRRAPGAGVDVTALDRAAADLGVPGAARRAIEAQAGSFDAVIIAAAYTGVDAAEDDEELALQVNGAAPGEIASVCAERAIPVFHISTDYVFDGAKDRPYEETDPVAPVGAYGRSKLAGEQAVAAACPQHVILRTAWVYAAHGRNFVRTMLRLGAERDALRVVDDQRGNPTAAGDIADALLAMVRAAAQGRGAWGTYHYVGAGETTWRGFADAIFDGAQPWLGRRPVVEPITTADFPTPAARPANSTLNCAKIQRDYGVTPRPWREIGRASCRERV